MHICSYHPPAKDLLNIVGQPSLLTRTHCGHVLLNILQQGDGYGPKKGAVCLPDEATTPGFIHSLDQGQAGGANRIQLFSP